MKRRVIAFAGSAVAVEWDSDQAARIVDFVLRDAPRGGAAPPHTIYCLAAENGALTLRRDGSVIYHGDNPLVAAELLMGEVCRRLAEESREGLLFHAAGLTWKGRGLLMPGSIAAGKTTLTAWLTLKGCDYLTDELVFIPQGSNTMQTFTRPLNLKSREPLSAFFDFDRNAPHLLGHAGGNLIPPALLNPDNTLSEPSIDLILFPNYTPGEAFALSPLPGAQAGLALMECLVNARNLPEHGLGEISRLARTAPAHRLRYSHFDQIGDRIQTLLAEQ